ncbi:hypothetical protein LCGC14_2051380 [marine sediment metagenome]|uniref:Uncharacterized protein n=1 Tax=marine sediment metagenome TaxID=412755 RepID=A0A0F9ENX7_9ZZZZ
MEEDYSDLFEKDFTITSPNRTVDMTITGKLVGIDPDIGITIVDKNDRDHYIYCLRSGLTLGPKGKGNKKFYADMFEVLVQGIRAGEIKREDVQDIELSHNFMLSGGKASPETCAFN